MFELNHVLYLSCALRSQRIKCHSYQSNKKNTVFCFIDHQNNNIEDYLYRSESIDDSKNELGKTYIAKDSQDKSKLIHNCIYIDVQWLQKSQKIQIPRYFDHINIHLPQIFINFQDKLLIHLFQSMEPIFSSLSNANLFSENISNVAKEAKHSEFKDNIISAKNIPHPSGSDRRVELPTELLWSDKRTFIKKIFISEIYILASIHLDSFSIQIDIEKTPLQFQVHRSFNKYDEPSKIVSDILGFYFAKVIMSTPMILGSFELIGNPVGLIRSIKQGLNDLFQMPLEAIQDGQAPRIVIYQIIRGGASLVLNISEGTLRSIAGVTNSFTGILDRLSMNKELSKEQNSILNDKNVPLKLKLNTNNSYDQSSTASKKSKHANENDDVYQNVLTEKKDIMSGNTVDNSVESLFPKKNPVNSELNNSLQHSSFSFSSGQAETKESLQVCPDDTLSQMILNNTIGFIRETLIFLINKPVSSAANYLVQSSCGLIHPGVNNAVRDGNHNVRRYLPLITNDSLLIKNKILQPDEQFRSVNRIIIGQCLLYAVLTFKKLILVGFKEENDNYDIIRLVDFELITLNFIESSCEYAVIVELPHYYNKLNVLDFNGSKITESSSTTIQLFFPTKELCTLFIRKTKKKHYE